MKKEPAWKYPKDYRLTQYERELVSSPDGVRSLELSVRAFNCLVPPGASPSGWNILTIEELCEQTPRLLGRRRGLGAQCLAEIIVALAGRGRQLKNAEDVGAKVRRRIRKLAEDHCDALLAEVLPVDEVGVAMARPRKDCKHSIAYYLMCRAPISPLAHLEPQVAVSAMPQCEVMDRWRSGAPTPPTTGSNKHASETLRPGRLKTPAALSAARSRQSTGEPAWCVQILIFVA